MKKSTPLAPLFAVLLLMLAGCSRASAPPPPAGAATLASGPTAGGEVGVTSLPASDRSLVVTMNVAITVDKVDAAAARINTAVRQAGGYVADQSTSGADNDKSASLELRVPADKATAVRSSLGDLGEITSADEKVEDVTEQRADIEARLHNARVQEKRVLELLGQKATSINELVEAEKELARVRENIERLEAQDRVMKSKISLATIHVRLKSKSVPAWQTPGASLVRAGETGVRGAAAISVYAGMALFTVAPTLIPIAAVLLGIFMLARRRRPQAAACGG